MKFRSSRITWIGPSGSMVSARPGHQTVALLGEMDISTAPACRDQLDHALDAAAARNRQLIIDLSGVSFCDAAGLSTLVAAQNRARSLATTVSLAAPCPLLVKLLHITGLDRGLAVHTTIAGAIKALHTCAGPPKARLGTAAVGDEDRRRLIGRCWSHHGSGGSHAVHVRSEDDGRAAERT